MNEILSAVDAVDKITEKPVTITVTVKPKSLLHKILIKLKIRPATHVFELKPIVVGNMYRISAQVIQIPDDVLEGNIIRAVMQTSFEHMSKLVYVVAIGLQNDAKEPSKSLLKFIENEFTAKDIVAVFNAILSQLDISNFINSIISMKGTEILTKRVSPAETGELIAPQES